MTGEHGVCVVRAGWCGEEGSWVSTNGAVTSPGVRRQSLLPASAASSLGDAMLWAPRRHRPVANGGALSLFITLAALSEPRTSIRWARSKVARARSAGSRVLVPPSCHASPLCQDIVCESSVAPSSKMVMKKTILLKRAESSSRCVCGGGSGHLSLSLRDGGHVRDGPGGGRRVLSLFLAGPLALAGFALPSLPAVAAPVAEQAGARWLHAPDR